MTNRILVLASALLSLSGVGCVEAVSLKTGRATPSDSGDVRKCSLAVAAVDTLIDATGRQLYVAPTAVVIHPSGEILIAGFPNYVFDTRSDQRPMPVAENEILGVTVGADRKITVIPAPIDPLRITGIAAFAQDPGDWEVVFAEYASAARPEHRLLTDTVVALWYGVLRNGLWTEVERQPFPSEWRVWVRREPTIARSADRITWAADVHVPGAPLQIALITRGRDGWSQDLLAKPRPPAMAIEYIGLDTLVLAEVLWATGSAGDSDGSAILITCYLSGAEIDSVGLGGREPTESIEWISLGIWGPRLVASWKSSSGAGTRARASVDALMSPHRPPVEVAPLEGFDALRLAAPVQNESFLWIAQRRHAPDSEEFVFRTLTASGDTSTTRLDDPFVGPARGAIVHGRREIVLTGPVGMDATSTVASAVLRLRTTC